MEYSVINIANQSKIVKINHTITMTTSLSMDFIYIYIVVSDYSVFMHNLSLNYVEISRLYIRGIFKAYKKGECFKGK